MLTIMVFICLYQVNDIKLTRIDHMLTEISETMLCDLPERIPWTVKEFQDNMEVRLCLATVISKNFSRYHSPCFLS